MEIMSVPFSGYTLETGAEFSGILRLENEQFIIEFQVPTLASSLGLGSPQAKQALFQLEQIAEITLNKSILGNTLLLRTHTIINIKDFPNVKQGIVRLPIKKKYIPQAEEIIGKFQLLQAESKLRSLNQDNDTNKQ